MASSVWGEDPKRKNLPRLGIDAMYVIRQGPRVSISTPAKLNLFLELISRRADGFHELDTLMTPISLYDRLSLTPRADSNINLSCAWSPGNLQSNRSELPAAENNLAHRALTLLQARSGVEQGADVFLSKRIPAEAGLGGGSSDAMAALVAGNLAWDLGWSREQLSELGGELGSDVAFFAHANLKRCTGRGEKTESLPTPARMHFVVVKPDDGLSTAKVFRQAVVPPRPTSSDSIISAIAVMDLASIGKLLFNRLQQAASELTSWVDEIRDVMSGLSVLGHQLSGSGTSYFALCRNHRHARLIAAKLRASGLGQVFAVTSLGLSPST